MPYQVFDSFPQNRVKECFVPCPTIDLTLRCNGEQYPQILTPQRRVVPARMLPQTVAPTAPIAGAGTFPANKYWCYRVVNAAETAFPLVQNERTGGGSLGPRSNPSPSVTVNSTVNTNIRTVTFSSVDSLYWWVSHIWIYRTDYYDTQAEAENASNAGLMFWIGHVQNNPNVFTLTFNDDNLPLKEQIENDNFVAPQFKRAVYSNNYFWGFCNDPLVVEVDIDNTGFLTIVDYPNDRWYDGRNGQLIRLDGIDSGGFDNHGTFYFFSYDTQTGQLYSDLALTNKASTQFSGRTMATIVGPSTRLYRSKLNNPFAWGDTDLVGEAQVPAPWFFDVGGGIGKAITVVPNLSLLKLDMEAPNKTVVLNLKNAGTPNFQTSLRSLAENYCVSIHESQFPATLDRGQNVIWGADTKSVNLVECDGGSQRPTSSKVYRTLRSMQIDGTSEIMYHGAYAQRMEMNCFFFRTIPQGDFDDFPYNDKLIFQHGPTGYWGSMDVYDINCAIEMVDNGRIRLMAGNSEGWIGELFADDQYSMWFTPFMSLAGVFNRGFGTEFYYAAGGGVDGQFISGIGQPTFTNLADENVAGIIGNWVTIVRRPADPTVATQIFIGHVSGTVTDGIPNHNGLSFDKVLQRLQSTLVDVGTIPAFNNINYPGTWTGEWYIGLIESVAGRAFTIGQPQNDKKLEEFWSNWIIPTPFTIVPPTVEYQLGYLDWFGGTNEKILSEKEIGDATALTENLINTLKPKVYAHTSGIPIDLGKVYGIIVRDRNYVGSRLLNYDMQVTLADTSSR